MATMWTLHWELNSNMLMNLYFAGGNVSFFGEYIEFSIEREHYLNIGIIKGTDMDTLIKENDYNFLIIQSKKIR